MSSARYVWLYLLAAALAGTAQAQTQYPTKPVRFILPFPPGGGTDTLARIIGGKLGEGLGQQIIMENRPGAGANIGAEVAARSVPDGYTMLMGNVAHAMSVTLYRKLNYNLVRDFAPVCMLASTPNIVVVHPSVPAKTVKELIALARARPGALDLASSGNGSSPHLAGVLFQMMTNTKMNHVPYKGGGPAVVALLGGEVSVGFATTPSVIQHVRSGRIRGLAVTSAARAPFAPQLPTVSEAGVKGYEAITWYGLLVPARTPAPVIMRLNAVALQAIKAPEVTKRLDTSGYTATGSTPEAFGIYIRSEIEKWGKVIRVSGVQVN